MFAVVAPSNAAARAWADDRGLAADGWLSVESSNSLAGRADLRIVTLPGWTRRSNYRDIGRELDRLVLVGLAVNVADPEFDRRRADQVRRLREIAPAGG